MFQDIKHFDKNKNQFHDHTAPNIFIHKYINILIEDDLSKWNKYAIERYRFNQGIQFRIILPGTYHSIPVRGPPATG